MAIPAEVFMKNVGYYNGEMGLMEEMKVPMLDRALYLVTEFMMRLMPQTAKFLKPIFM